MRSRATALRLTALLLGLVVGLGAAEIALRVRDALAEPPEPPVRRAVPGGPRVKRWTPGLRPRPRVLVVGDSFTWGDGVAEAQAYPKRLADELYVAGAPAQVVSFSRPGWNTRLELLHLRERWDRLEPDLLVLGHCLNDAEPVRSGEMLRRHPELLPWEPRGAASAWLARNSRLYAGTRRALDSIRLRRELRDYYHGLYEDRAGRRQWRRSLNQIRELATERSVPALLVIFPIFDSQPERYAYAAIHDRVARVATRQGWLVLDLLGAYQGMDGRELAVLPYTDPHPSALAHGIAGAEIARFLLAKGLLGAPVQRPHQVGELPPAADG